MNVQRLLDDELPDAAFLDELTAEDNTKATRLTETTSATQQFNRWTARGRLR